MKKIFLFSLLLLLVLFLGEFLFLLTKNLRIGQPLSNSQINVSPPPDLQGGEPKTLIDGNLNTGLFGRPPYSVEFILPEKITLAKISLFFSKNNPPALFQIKGFKEFSNVFPTREIYLPPQKADKITLDIIPNSQASENLANISEVTFYPVGKQPFFTAFVQSLKKTPSQLFFHRYYLANLSFWGAVLAAIFDLLLLLLIFNGLALIFKKEWLILFAAIILYIIIISFLGIRQYQGFHYVSAGDPASRAQAYWNTVRGGHFLRQNVELCDCSTLIGHLQWFIILFIPFYALLPRPETMIVVQNIFVALGAMAVYLIALDLFKKKNLSLFFALFYLFYPFLHFVSFNAFPEEVFSIPLILFAFYFFQRKRFWPFLIFAVLVTGTKEVAGFITASFGFLAIFWKRPLKWILTPLLVGLGIVAILLQILVYWTKNITFTVDQKLVQMSHVSISVYGHLGATPLEMIKNLATHPIKYFLYLFSANKISFLVSLFKSLGFLPIFGLPLLIISAPTFIKNHLLQPQDFADVVGGGRAFYLAPIIPGLIIATIYGFNWIIKRVPKITWLLMIILTFSTLLSAQIWSPTPLNKNFLGMKMFDVSDKNQQIWQAIKLIPPGSKVATDFSLFTGLTNHSELKRTSVLLDQDNLRAVDFILVADQDELLNKEALFKKIAQESSWQLIFQQEKVYLFKKQ